MPQALIFHSSVDNAEDWRRALAAALPEVEFRTAADAADPDEVLYALVWEPPHGFFARYRNLQLVTNLGAGIDRLCRRDDLGPAHISRLADPGMAQLMTSYVLYAATHYARDFHIFERAQRQGVWTYLHPRSLAEVKVGVLGLGSLGAAAARALAAAGYDTSGWSASPKTLPAIRCLTGEQGLRDILAGSEILVCMLPLTPQTTGLLNRERLALMPAGAKFVNVARGAIVDEAALVEALETRRIGEAMLDVFAVEPLPQGHPLWSLDNVRITPHLASITIPRLAARDVAESIRRVRAGGIPLHHVDPTRGY